SGKQRLVARVLRGGLTGEGINASNHGVTVTMWRFSLAPGHPARRTGRRAVHGAPARSARHAGPVRRVARRRPAARPPHSRETPRDPGSPSAAPAGTDAPTPAPR